MNVVLGKKVRDTITQFAGIVTGHVEYLTGCNQSLIQPPVKPDGDWVESRWIDDERLSVVAEEPVSLSAERHGADKAAPKR